VAVLTRPVERLLYSRGGPIVQPIIVEHRRPAELLEELTRSQILSLIRSLRARLGVAEASAFFPRVIRHLNLVAIPATVSLIEDLADRREVGRIFIDRMMRALQLPTVPAEGVYAAQDRRTVYYTSTYWTTRLVGADKARQAGVTGSSVTVSVIDTAAVPEHPTLRGAAWATSYPGIFTDSNGHGIWCAGAIAGRLAYAQGIPVEGGAPGVRLLLYKGLITPVGIGFQSALIDAMVNSVLSFGAKVVSMSLGSDETPSNPEDDAQVVALERLTRENGAIFCVAAGNCLAKDTMVYTSSNGVKEICQLKPGDMVFALDFEVMGDGVKGSPYRLEARIVPRKVLRVMKNGIRPVYRVRTSTREIRATDNHPFLVYDRGRLVWKPLRDIKVGDMIAITKSVPVSGAEISEDLAFILGVYLGDGYYRIRKGRYGERGEVVFYVPPEDALYVELKTRLKRLGYEPHDVQNNGKVIGVAVYSLKLAKLLESFGFVVGATKKEVPSTVFNFSRVARMAFLEGYIRSDGTKKFEKSSTTDNRIERWDLESPNKKLIMQLRHLAIMLGLRVTKLKSKMKHIKIFNGHEWYEYNSKSWHFSIYPNSSKKYMLGTMIPSGFLNEYIGFERIQSIELDGVDEVYDIEVEGSHNFVAEGVIVHNSGPDPGTINTPGIAESALTVSSYNPVTGEISPFASRGPTPDGRIKPDCVMPGENILGPVAGMLDAVTRPRAPPLYAVLSGTSMATPHASMLVALIVDHAARYGINVTVDTIKDVLRLYGEYPGELKNNEYGWGVLTWDKWITYAREVLGIK